METEKFADSAQGFAKSPLGIIALFIVLVYGFASLVVGAISVGLSKESGTTSVTLLQHMTPLIYFMVLFPVIVFLVSYGWLQIITINFMAHPILKMKIIFSKQLCPASYQLLRQKRVNQAIRTACPNIDCKKS